MTLIKAIALAIAVLAGILLAGLLVVIIPILLPESRPYYARACSSLRQYFGECFTGKRLTNK